MLIVCFVPHEVTGQGSVEVFRGQAVALKKRDDARSPCRVPKLSGMNGSDTPSEEINDLIFSVSPRWLVANGGLWDCNVGRKTTKLNNLTSKL